MCFRLPIRSRLSAPSPFRRAGELRTHLDTHVEDSAEAPIFTTPTGDRVRISNWRHRVWQPAAAQLEFPSWATPYVLRHTAASLMAQSGVPVTAAAAALGHDPAV